LKTIIAGSRSIDTLPPVLAAIKKSGWEQEISEVVCGCAYGVDNIGASWAVNRGIWIKNFRPDWERYGKAAGAIRNMEMARYADALIAVWDGESLGTKHMIRMAKDKGLKIYVHNLGDPFVQAELSL
jgi:hypothetical protein